MRLYSSLIAALIAPIILASCSNSFPVAVPTIGRNQDLPVADIETALSAFSAPTRHDASLGAIEVTSHNEIRIYQDNERRNFTSMVRVKGKWEIGRVVLVHPAY